MKHLKKFEMKTINYKDMTSWGSTKPVEKQEPFDIDYIRFIFSYFIDSNNARIEDVIINDKNSIDTHKVIITFDDLIEDNDINTYISYFSHIKEGIDRLKDEYDNITYQLFKTYGEYILRFEREIR